MPVLEDITGVPLQVNAGDARATAMRRILAIHAAAKKQQRRGGGLTWDETAEALGVRDRMGRC